MSLGSSLFQGRKQSGMSQEAVAEKLGVSRQTVSKWETDETLPDIRQAKRLAMLYGLTLDELIDFDLDVQELERVVRNTSEEVQQKVDWNKLWAEQYPVLASYRQEVDVDQYTPALRELLRKLSADHGYSELDAFLVLKDILAAIKNYADILRQSSTVNMPSKKSLRQ